MLAATEHGTTLAWESFLSTGTVPAGVRPSTARSWLRSRAFGVSPDGPLDLRYTGPVDGDTALLRAARPVAEQLFVDLDGTDTAMVLTDAEARVLGHWSGDQRLVADLEKIGATPGFVFEESRVGTSALGSVLEERQPVQVLGHEHYVEALQNFAAVGVPVVHPVSGRIEGVVDLVCPSDRQSPMMLPLVTRAASEIGARLLTGYAGQDRVLLDAYLQADRRGPRRSVLAINGRVLIVNQQVADLLGPLSHAVLWEHVRRSLSEGRTEFEHATDDAGTVIHGVISEVRDSRDRVGAVVHLRRREAAGAARRAPAAGTNATSLLRERLPGPSTSWQAALKRSAAVFSAGERLLLTGPAGVGKRALAIALCEVHDPLNEIIEHDAGDVQADVSGWLETLRAERAGRPSARVLTGVDRLDEAALDGFCRWLDRLPDDAPPTIATFSTGDDGHLPAGLASQFPHVVAVPSLADRPEDIPAIAEAVAREPGASAGVRLDPAALRLLSGGDWPGNVRQLRRLVLAARAVCPGTVIRPDDLPDRFRVSRPRHGLTRMQRLERETIMATMAAEGGNKRAVAASLGLSRSTLYRKLSALGLDD